MTADLQSPHTVYLYDFGTSRDGHFYFVMELLDGVSLQKLVQTFGPQPGSRVIAILRQVCLSLEEAHAHGMVHRDLKPSNVMLCKVALQHDFVKVLDFGLVKPTQAEEFTHLTVEGVSAGTPGYIAPEIAILSSLEVALVVAAQVLNIAHTEILAPGDDRHSPSADTKIAAEIIAQASCLISTINRYRLALLDPDSRLD